MPKKEDPVIRFWRKVQKTDGCWLWTSMLNSKGYGQFRIKPRRWIFAHRYSWELAFGPIPQGMNVLHRCDTPRCIRPDHLFLGTQQDNMADMAAKGRRVTHAKITDAARAEIVARYLRGEASQQRLAAEYGICRQRVTQLVREGRAA